jgi:hypothetical protein
LDATALVAIAGIIGTLLAPVVGELVRRKSTRKERLDDQRSEAYTHLLSAGVQFVDNAMNLASIPGADFPEPATDELNRLEGQIRLVASKSVRNLFQTFSDQLAKFRAAQFQAQLHHQAVVKSGAADDAQGIQQRLELGRMAEAIRDTYHELEAAMRKDVQS